MSMTREEAIELVCYGDWLNILMSHLGDDDINRLAEAMCIIGNALRPVSRERVEKLRGEWQVCFEDWRKQIAGDQCSKCGFQHYGTSINHYKFCPACGSPMTDEAVEMVMERLEELSNGKG